MTVTQKRFAMGLETEDESSAVAIYHVVLSTGSFMIRGLYIKL